MLHPLSRGPVGAGMSLALLPQHVSALSCTSRGELTLWVQIGRIGATISALRLSLCFPNDCPRCRRPASRGRGCRWPTPTARCGRAATCRRRRTTSRSHRPMPLWTHREFCCSLVPSLALAQLQSWCRYQFCRLVRTPCRGCRIPASILHCHTKWRACGSEISSGSRSCAAVEASHLAVRSFYLVGSDDVCV